MSVCKQILGLPPLHQVSLSVSLIRQTESISSSVYLRLSFSVGLKTMAHRAEK